MRKIRNSFCMFIFTLILGIISGKILYTKISAVYALNIKQNNIVYFLQLGVYKDKESMKYDTSDISNKLIIKEKDNYYVYVGLSRKKDNLKKISSIYEKLGYNLYLYEKVINDETFLSNLEQFDLLLSSANTIDEIESINAVILSSYEEMILKK